MNYWVLVAGDEVGFSAGFSFLTTPVKKALKYPHIEINEDITTTQSKARPAV